MQRQEKIWVKKTREQKGEECGACVAKKTFDDRPPTLSMSSRAPRAKQLNKWGQKKKEKNLKKARASRMGGGEIVKQKSISCSWLRKTSKKTSGDAPRESPPSGKKTMEDKRTSGKRRISDEEGHPSDGDEMATERLAEKREKLAAENESKFLSTEFGGRKGLVKNKSCKKDIEFGTVGHWFYFPRSSYPRKEHHQIIKRKRRCQGGEINRRGTGPGKKEKNGTSLCKFDVKYRTKRALEYYFVHIVGNKQGEKTAK